MAFILIPKNGEDVMINGWNWRPSLELLRKNNMIDDDLSERMGHILPKDNRRRWYCRPNC
jgi:hypothetical protein